MIYAIGINLIFIFFQKTKLYRQFSREHLQCHFNDVIYDPYYTRNCILKVGIVFNKKKTGSKLLYHHYCHQFFQQWFLVQMLRNFCFFRKEWSSSIDTDAKAASTFRKQSNCKECFRVETNSNYVIDSGNSWPRLVFSSEGRWGFFSTNLMLFNIDIFSNSAFDQVCL